MNESRHGMIGSRINKIMSCIYPQRCTKLFNHLSTYLVSELETEQKDRSPKLILISCIESNGTGVYLLKPSSKRKRTAKEMADYRSRLELEADEKQDRERTIV